MDKVRFPSEHPTRRAWQGMMNRCYSPTNKDYPGIGGRGIKVCDRWHTYENFYADMGDKPENSIFTRYVGTMDFTPDNCYWQEKVNAASNKLYSIWKGVRRRCGVICSPDAMQKHYMGRGIDMAPDWAESFPSFARDVGQPPSDDHQLDRINNDEGYWPGNVRWVLSKDNANNRSDNVWVEMPDKNGVRQRWTLQQWCEYHDVDRATVSGRWAALFEQPKQRFFPVQQVDLATGTVLAVFDTAKNASEATGIKRGTIQKCLSGGNASAGGFGWCYKK